MECESECDMEEIKVDDSEERQVDDTEELDALADEEDISIMPSTNSVSIFFARVLFYSTVF